VHALLALMCLNASRFEARTYAGDEVMDMEQQDRGLWDKTLIDKGLHHLDAAQQHGAVSSYLILAGISAHHSIAQTYAATNWREILWLYDALLELEPSPMVKLNRLVAYAKVQGAGAAIAELLKLTMLSSNHLYCATLAELYLADGHHEEATRYYQKAIALSDNERDRLFLLKKMNGAVPISNVDVYKEWRVMSDE